MSEYRKQIDTSDELGEWYSRKYLEMGDGWNTPAEECNKHLDDLGVPFDKSKMLLDVGCGAGHFLVEAVKRVDAFGIEISKVGLELCLNRHVPVYLVDIGEPLVHSFAEVQFDYIVSLGSLEHIVNLDQALDNIRGLLKPDGKFYFFCPNELWKHFDQPNERTMTDDEWSALFAAHGLYVESRKRWNDNTAFIGTTERLPPEVYVAPNGNKLNIGSGQRRFDTGHGWINVDCVSRPPDQVPDLICDVGKEPLPYPDNSMDVAVLHHMYEHLHLGEGHGLIREVYRTLKPGGSLIVTVPDMRALAERWLAHQISDYIFNVNVYGAYQGLESDTHQWSYTFDGFKADLQEINCIWSDYRPFNWRAIPGADIARDWWILGLEAIK